MNGSLQRLIARAERAPIVPSSGWSAWLVTVVTTVMGFLAMIALTGALAAERLADAWRGNLDGMATVEVIAPPDRLAARVDRALAVLETAEGIAAARRLTDAEHEALLAPWLGSGIEIADLPAPRLISVTVEGAGPDRSRLQARLDNAAPGARYDDHDAWRAPLITAARRVSLLGWTGALMIGVAAAATVAFAVRATLTAQAEIVRVVRLIGGEDRYIARAFVRRLLLRGFAGGLGGAGLAAGALMGLPAMTADAAAFSLMPAPEVRLALVLAVGTGSAAISWAAAALSVRLLLGRMV